MVGGPELAALRYFLAPNLGSKNKPRRRSKSRPIQQTRTGDSSLSPAPPSLTQATLVHSFTAFCWRPQASVIFVWGRKRSCGRRIQKIESSACKSRIARASRLTSGLLLLNRCVAFAQFPLLVVTALVGYSLSANCKLRFATTTRARQTTTRSRMRMMRSSRRRRGARITRTVLLVAAFCAPVEEARVKRDFLEEAQASDWLSITAPSLVQFPPPPPLCLVLLLLISRKALALLVQLYARASSWQS